MRRLAIFVCCLLLSAPLLSTARIFAQGEITVSVANGLPEEIRAAVDALSEIGAFRRVEEGEAQVQLVNGSDRAAAASLWAYVPVVPFASTIDEIRYSDILAYWQGNGTALAYLSVNGTVPTFIITHSTLMWLTYLFGVPAANVPIEVVTADVLVDTLWQRRPASWSLVPFHQLVPQMKALRVDTLDVFDRTLALNNYPLVQAITAQGDAGRVESVVRALESSIRWRKLNRDPERMTVLVMTGVTALVRATAWVMETTGIEYPVGGILPFLADADIIHTSNEVSFDPNCPYPDPSYQTSGLIFCSRDSYFALLQAMNLKVVELTGNHVKDYGAEALLHTLGIYDANNIGYFGGGRTQEDARRALVVAGRGGSVAFLGCNPAGPQFAWATSDSPGAAMCEDDFLRAEIAQLKAHGAIVIMTLQYQEYYSYAPPADQIAFFKKYVEMGADIVIGSQAHQPQGFGFSGQAFIHYGTGNLFFDQMDSLGTRQMFADKFIMYEGRHLNTILFTGLIENYARPRPMTADERASFLATIFQASGW